MTARHSAIDAIVIGGSAGGVHALSQLLAALPARVAVPIIALIHTGERQPNLLMEALGTHCAAPLAEPFDKQAIEPGVWLAPAGYHLLIDDDCFALSVDAPVKFSRPSIDVLFESASDRWRNHLAAFVLTGASDDGAAGAVTVRRRGGLLFVEDPTTADTRIMPDATIAAAPPDVVAPIEQLREHLARLANVELARSS